MLEMWLFTVAWPMTRMSAISRFVAPVLTRRSTSRSRSVSPAFGAPPDPGDAVLGSQRGGDAVGNPVLMSDHQPGPRRAPHHGVTSFLAAMLGHAVALPTERGANPVSVVPPPGVLATVSRPPT